MTDAEKPPLKGEQAQVQKEIGEERETIEKPVCPIIFERLKPAFAKEFSR